MSKKIGNLKGEPGKQADTPVIPWPRGGGSGVIVQDEGTNLNAGKIVSAVDFEGAGVTAAMSGTKAVVTIPGSQGGGGVTVTQSDTDPGAIGAGNFWLNTAAQTGSSYPLLVRDPTNSFWRQASLGDRLVSDGSVSSSQYIVDADANVIGSIVFNSVGFTAEINSDLGDAPRATLGLSPGGGITLTWSGMSGPTARILLDAAGIAFTGDMGFFGHARTFAPEVPAIATPQDIIDALVALGLITQAP